MIISGVHCTHGFNRSGFLIIAYLIERDDWRYEIWRYEFPLHAPDIKRCKGAMEKDETCRALFLGSSLKKKTGMAWLK